MKQYSTSVSGLRAARVRGLLPLFPIMGLAFAPLVHADVSVVVGGDAVAGDQATLSLDATVPNALSYDFSPPGTVAKAYFTAHLFCAETPRTPTQTRLDPRYQLPAGRGDDVWKFPDVYVQNLDYVPGGIRIGHAATGGARQYRCLTALPGGSLEPWHVYAGLFDSGFGDYIGASYSALNTPPPQDPPAGPHQNIKVVAQQFTGFAGLEVSIARVEMQFDLIQPASADWLVVDGFNSAALADSVTWCLLRPDWVDGSAPPSNLCDDASILFPGVPKSTGSFVRQGLGIFPGFPALYVLAYRTVIGAPTAGTAKQAFAALRIGGGMPGVAEERQDWYPNDSVWYTY